MELKRIGAFSLGKIACLFGIIYGLISAILIVILYANLDVIPGIAEQMSPIVTQFGYWSLLIFPLLNGVIYFIAGILAALIYNLLAGWLGGVQLHFKEEKKR